MKTNPTHKGLLLNSFYPQLSYFSFHRIALSFCFFALYRLLISNSSIEECLFKILAISYTGITTVLFNYKKTSTSTLCSQNGFIVEQQKSIFT